MNAQEIAEKTAIIVTSYNPQIEELRGNIQSYCLQVSLVLICDNSDSKLSQLEVNELGHYFSNVVVVPMNGNKGIAAAQNAGLECAVKRGYEYFVEMDQDSRLPSNYVVRIASSFLSLLASGVSVAGIGPVAVRSTDGFVYNGIKRHVGLVEVDKTLSSGFFFSRGGIDRVGVKDETLFIDYVDWEWCWRAQSMGLKVFVNTDLEILHFLGAGHRKILLWHLGIPAPIRHYYQYRNSLYMLSKRYVPFSWKLRRVVINVIKVPLYIVFGGMRYKRLRYITKGVVDYCAGKTGAVSLKAVKLVRPE